MMAFTWGDKKAGRGRVARSVRIEKNFFVADRVDMRRVGRGIVPQPAVYSSCLCLARSRLGRDGMRGLRRSRTGSGVNAPPDAAVRRRRRRRRIVIAAPFVV